MQQDSADVAAAAGKDFPRHAGRHDPGGSDGPGGAKSGPDREAGPGAHQPPGCRELLPEAAAAAAESRSGHGR